MSKLALNVKIYLQNNKFNELTNKLGKILLSKFTVSQILSENIAFSQFDWLVLTAAEPVNLLRSGLSRQHLSVHVWHNVNYCLFQKLKKITKFLHSTKNNDIEHTVTVSACDLFRALSVWRMN